MTEEEFQGLKQSISQNGQMASIAYWKGMLVDGRHRLRACESLESTLWPASFSMKKTRMRTPLRTTFIVVVSQRLKGLLSKQSS